MSKRTGGFETFSLSDYSITEDGKVFNKKWGNYVKPQPNGKGYLRVHIAGRFYFVHRLVAEMYVPNPENLPQVNHKDGDKTNNKANNLEWVSNGENRNHAVLMRLQIHGEKCPWAKLSQNDVDYIRAHPEKTRKELSEKFGVSPHTISDIRTKRSWK